MKAYHTTSQVGGGELPRLSTDDISNNCGPLRHPFTCQVVGATGSGKTQFVKKLLEHRQTLIEPTPGRIIFWYSEWQPMYTQLSSTVPGIEFHQGIPEELDDRDYLDTEIHNLIVIDDLIQQSIKDKRITNLFTRGSHHRNLSIILITQNMFQQGSESRTISLNTLYLVLFKNVRDQTQVNHLARQMYPGNPNKLLQAYRSAVSKPYGYLLIDLKADTDDKCRLRPNAFDQPEKRATTMEHKMADVFKGHQINRAPQLTKMIELDREMDRVHEDPSLPIDVKVKLHQQALNRYLIMSRKLKNRSLQMPIMPTANQIQDEEEDEELMLPDTPPPAYRTNMNIMDTPVPQDPSPILAAQMHLDKDELFSTPVQDPMNLGVAYQSTPSHVRKDILARTPISKLPKSVLEKAKRIGDSMQRRKWGRDEEVSNKRKIYFTKTRSGGKKTRKGTQY